VTPPRPLHTRLHGRRDTPSSRPISFDAAPSSTAGVSLDVDFVVERAGGGFTLAKKSLNVRGDMDELVAAFKEALGTQDAGGLEMCVDHAAATSTCMMDLGFREGVQWKKNLVPTFAAYYDAEKCRVTVKGMMEVSKEYDEDDARSSHEARPGACHAPTDPPDSCGDTSVADKTAEWQPGRLRHGRDPAAGVAVRPRGGASVVLVVLVLREARGSGRAAS
jgi:hypothetical protein